MQLIENRLKVVRERWEDPGVYPSNAGGGPLPARMGISGIEGWLKVRLEKSDLEEILRNVLEGIDWGCGLLNEQMTGEGIRVTEYRMLSDVSDALVCRLWPTRWEVDGADD